MMLPVSVVIATRDRPAALARTLRSLLTSTEVPEEFVIIDASNGPQSAEMATALFAADRNAPRLVWRRASEAGAAPQRNQGVALAACDTILFCDDDIVCEAECVARLWQTMHSDGRIGAVNAAIVNQGYVRPGLLTRLVLAMMGIEERNGYAGRLVGPAVNFLPRAGTSADAVPVEWLNLTCALYRRALLPEPPLDAFFTGYSFGEDVALSLRVIRRANLVHAPAARIYHDSQPGPHKASSVGLSRMQLINRHYIMTQVMGRRAAGDYLRLMLWECFQLGASAVRNRLGRPFWHMVQGRLLGLVDLVHGRRDRVVV